MFLKAVRVPLVVVLGVFLSLAWVSSLPAQGKELVDLLIVNESQDPAIAGQVTLLSAPLRQIGLFAIGLQAAQVSSSFDDPLGVNSSGKTYDIIVIVPLALGHGNLTQVWVVSCPITSSMPANVIRGVQAIKNVVEGGTQGRVQAATVQDDAVPAFFSTVFQLHGWLHCG